MHVCWLGITPGARRGLRLIALTLCVGIDTQYYTVLWPLHKIIASYIRHGSYKLLNMDPALHDIHHCMLSIYFLLALMLFSK